MQIINCAGIAARIRLIPKWKYRVEKDGFFECELKQLCMMASKFAHFQIRVWRVDFVATFKIPKFILSMMKK